MIMLVGFSLPVLLEAVALKKAPPKKIMLVGFCIPVRLSGLYIKEVPHPIMLVGFYPPVRLSGQQRGGLKCKIYTGIQKPTRAVVGA